MNELNYKNNNNLNTISEHNQNIASTGNFGYLSTIHEYNNNNIDENKANQKNDFQYTNNNSFENIKFIPSYFTDIESALKKSNNNVIELKNTVREKIKIEKKLKEKLTKYKSENRKLTENLLQSKTNEKSLYEKYNKLKSENITLSENLQHKLIIQNKYEKLLDDYKKILNINEELSKKIEEYEKNIQYLQTKNKKYISANGVLKTEINNLGENIEGGVKFLQSGLEKMTSANLELKKFIKKLEEEQKNLLDENYQYMNENKNLKIEIKQLLHEKINLSEENKELNIKNENLNKIINDMNKAISEITEQNIKYKNLESDYNDMKEKYDIEKLNLNSQLNLWKKNFIEICKYKLTDYNTNIENIININEKYIDNAPKNIITIPSKILIYFKLLIDQEKYNTPEIKELKDSLDTEKDNLIKVYKNLLNEKNIRRKLVNKYTKLRGNTYFLCRLKPININNEKIINKDSQLNTYYLKKNYIIIKNTNNKNNSIKKYEYDYIFPEETSQQELYEEISPFIHLLFKGENICLFSYGIKNSGKTYDIVGSSDAPGICSKAINEMFSIINNCNSKKYNNNFTISMSIIEIKNEEIYNLLNENCPKMTIRQNSKSFLVMPDLKFIKVQKLEEMYNLLNKANQFQKNENNNNSHRIFNFILMDKENLNIKGNLVFVDLHFGIEESVSLECLQEELIYIIKNRKISDINCNKSLLTHYFKEYLQDRFKILFLLNINQDINKINETLDTMDYVDKIFKVNN